MYNSDYLERGDFIHIYDNGRISDVVEFERNIGNGKCYIKTPKGRYIYQKDFAFVYASIGAWTYNDENYVPALPGDLLDKREFARAQPYFQAMHERRVAKDRNNAR